MRYKQVNKNYRYFWVYKPFQMLSQFSREGKYNSLEDLDFKFPKDVYPVGRLDADSEGLLLLTNDTTINHKLLSPKNNHIKNYWVQVDGNITSEAIHVLRSGVDINLKGKIYRTKKAEVELLPDDKIRLIPERNPPVRFRKNIPTTWINIELTEGKNRQIRRMTAKVGFPTLRIVRYSVEKLKLTSFESGRVEEVDKSTFYNLLNL